MPMQAMPPEITRSERVTLRFREHEREAIESAAESQRMPLSEWARTTLLDRAARQSKGSRARR